MRGRNVSPGYWAPGEAPLTDGEGWLRTGDLGQQDARGNLYFRGRRKEVIVTSAGLNVYPADIEAALTMQPEIGGSAVVGVDGPQGPEPVAVLIMRRPETDPSTAVQRANQRLSPYQQIRHWVVWPGRDFPRTATQKVRKGDLVRFVSRQGGEPTGQGGDNQESLLGEILAMVERITGASPVRRDREANLTSDLKLDSLARVALITQLEDRFQLDLDENQVTAALTLGDLESLLQPSDRLPEASQPEAARPTPGTGGRIAGSLGISPGSKPIPAGRGNIRHSLAPLPLSPLGLEAARRLDPISVPARSHLAAHPFALLDPGGWTKTLARTAAARAGDRQSRDLFRSGPHPLLPTLSLQEPAGHRHDRRKAAGLSIPAAGARDFPLHGHPGLWGDRRWVQWRFRCPSKAGFAAASITPGRPWIAATAYWSFRRGARTKDGEIQPFQSGIGLLAAGLGAPVVPARIEGLYELKQKRSGGVGWPFARPGQVSVTFGPPLQPSPSDSPQALTRELEERLRGLSHRTA